MDERAGRTPPHSLEAERGLLGSILLANGDTGEIFELVHPESFYSRRHQLIFRGIQELVDRHSSVDSILLRETLERDGVLEEAGGLPYLVELTESVRTSVNALKYAQILRDRALLRGLIQVAGEMIEGAYDGAGQDAREYLNRCEQKLFDLAQFRRSEEVVGIRDAVKQAFDLIDELKKGGRHLSTGYYDLDTMLGGGMHPSELIVVAGRPSMGKTTLALNIARHVAVGAKKPVLLFSLEVDHRQIAMNLLCGEARVRSNAVRTSSFEESEWDHLMVAADRLSMAPIFIDDSSTLNTIAIRAKARRMKAKHDIQLVIVDYLQLLEMGAGRPESRQQEITTISRSLKALAREFRVPVITVSQLSRAVEAREAHRPRMSDLRESGSIEQDADVVLLLYRDEYYHPERDGSKGQAELIIAKQRNGPVGSVFLNFTADKLLFDNPTRERERF